MRGCCLFYKLNEPVSVVLSSCFICLQIPEMIILLFCCTLLHWEKVLDAKAFFSYLWVLACHHKCKYKNCCKKYLHGIKLQLFHILQGMGKEDVCGISCWVCFFFFLVVFLRVVFFFVVVYFSSPLTFEATSFTFLG